MLQFMNKEGEVVMIEHDDGHLEGKLAEDMKKAKDKLHEADNKERSDDKQDGHR